MLFRKKIDRYCTYCQFAGKIDGESMVCQFCGVVPSDHHCRRFRYDPLRASPAAPRSKKLITGTRIIRCEYKPCILQKKASPMRGSFFNARTQVGFPLSRGAGPKGLRGYPAAAGQGLPSQGSCQPQAD